MKTNACVALSARFLPICFLLGVASAAQAQETRWSDPATWPDNTVPAAGEQVTIASGKQVILDVSPPALGGITLNGKRAACEYYVILHQGRTLDGYEFDFQTWSVTIDLHELRDGAWRICTRKMIYEKSRMDPHVPGSVPQSYYDSLDLSPFPPAIRFHCYRNLRSSGQMPKNLIMKGSPEEAAARREVAAWVA
jgi:hypothetical protein